MNFQGELAAFIFRLVGADCQASPEKKDSQRSSDTSDKHQQIRRHIPEDFVFSCSMRTPYLVNVTLSLYLAQHSPRRSGSAESCTDILTGCVVYLITGSKLFGAMSLFSTDHLEFM